MTMILMLTELVVGVLAISKVVQIILKIYKSIPEENRKIA